MDFTCNICGKRNTGVENFERETSNCARCGSSVRIRAVVYALSVELFGVGLELRDFPVLKALRGLGMTDSESYAKRLAEKFDYKNTYFDREPRLDITNIDPRDEGSLDFLISSEVFEHVHPPMERAFENAYRMLKPDGVLILTVPYRLRDQPSLEHFPQLADAGLVKLQSGHVLVNRAADGRLETFDDLVFHGGPGSTLEMRVLNETELRKALCDAGFSEVRFYADDCDTFGLRHVVPWSLPLSARKQPAALAGAARAELMQHFAGLVRASRNQKRTMRDLQSQLNHASLVIKQQDAELEERAKWAHGLDRNVHEAHDIIKNLEAELQKRTEWARDLERELSKRTEWALSLEKDVAYLKAITPRKWTVRAHSALGRVRGVLRGMRSRFRRAAGAAAK